MHRPMVESLESRRLFAVTTFTLPAQAASGETGGGTITTNTAVQGSPVIVVAISLTNTQTGNHTVVARAVPPA